jgi:hypothetical protein
MFLEATDAKKNDKDKKGEKLASFTPEEEKLLIAKL